MGGSVAVDGSNIYNLQILHQQSNWLPFMNVRM